MPIEKTVEYIKGCVIICAEGPFCERFLNVCMNRGIYLRNVRRMGKDKMFASVSIEGFRELRHIARKTRTRIHIHRIKKRILPRRMFLSASVQPCGAGPRECSWAPARS